jgi:hypothetical protein
MKIKTGLWALSFAFSVAFSVALSAVAYADDGFDDIMSANAGSVAMSNDYGKIQDFIKALAAQYPQNATLFELGQNGQGQSIIGLAIGHGSIHNLIVSTHHGNEYGATAVALGAAADLAANPIAKQTVYVIPVLNITGYSQNRREETLASANNAWEETTDPNRDYPGPCATSGPFHLQSTHALANFIDKMGIVASATLHTFQPSVTYPWGFSTHDLSTPYDALFIDLGKAATKYSQYEVGNSTALIYPADGAYEDYAFWKHGIWSLLFELGVSHTPSSSELVDLVKVNVPGLRNMMQTAPTERAPDHDFKGKCDLNLRMIDRHEE